MDTIQILAKLPACAHSTIPASEEWQVISTHKNNNRGIKNAYKSAANTHRAYTESHGNAAAHQVIARCGELEFHYGMLWKMELMDSVTPKNLAEAQTY